MLSCDRYILARSLPEALTAMKRETGSRIVAGATDLLPWAREGRAGDVNLPQLIDISRIEELSGWSLDGDRLWLGANTVLQQFLNDDDLAAHLPCMPYCSVWFADDQIREQATIGGNLVNASPAADGAPPMLVGNAEVEIAGVRDDRVLSRTISLESFIMGPGRTALDTDEIVVGFRCDSLFGYGGSFQKVGQRRSLVISAVCVAACVKLERSSGLLEDVRIAAAGIGPVPVRLHELEAILVGRKPDATLFKSIKFDADDLVASRTRRQYRRTVLKGFVETAVREAIRNAPGISSPNSAKELQHA